jgi:hypothetical protein
MRFLIVDHIPRAEEAELEMGGACFETGPTQTAFVALSDMLILTGLLGHVEQ